jgi:hypothetical protein
LRIIAGETLGRNLGLGIATAFGGNWRLLVDETGGAAIDNHAADVDDTLNTRREGGCEEVPRPHDHRLRVTGYTVDDAVDIGKRSFE